MKAKAHSELHKGRHMFPRTHTAHGYTGEEEKGRKEVKERSHIATDRKLVYKNRRKSLKLGRILRIHAIVLKDNK